MTPDPWQDAAAFLRFAIECDPQAIEEVLTRYADADLRQLITTIAIVVSASVVSRDDELKSLLRARFDEIALKFMSADDSDPSDPESNGE